MTDVVLHAFGLGLTSLLSPPVVAIGLVFAILLVLLGSGGGGSVRGRVRPKLLLTPPERRFLSILEDALPECRIYVQVAMGALIEPARGLSQRDRMRVRGRFSQKIVDYVIEHAANGEIIALVELDDRTHSAAADRSRDAITQAAGYRTVRFHRDRWPHPNAVRAAVFNFHS